MTVAVFFMAGSVNYEGKSTTQTEVTPISLVW